MTGSSVFSTSRQREHDALRRARRSRAIVHGASMRRAGYDLLGSDMLGAFIGVMLGVDSMESRLLLEKRLRSLWGLSLAGDGLTMRVAAWLRARCSSAAEDVSGAAGRRATMCATAAMREVCECCKLNGLLTKDGRLRGPCAECCSVDESSDRPGPNVFRHDPKMYLPVSQSKIEIGSLIGSFWYRKGCCATCGKMVGVW